jgi:hypothetical protein
MKFDSAQRKAQQRVTSARSNTKSQSATKENGKTEVTTTDFSYLQTASVWITGRPEFKKSRDAYYKPEANSLSQKNPWWRHCSRMLLIPKT